MHLNNAYSGGDNSSSGNDIGTDSEDIAHFCENWKNNELELRQAARSNKGVLLELYDAEQVHVTKGLDHKKDPTGSPN